jgi:hypothetical protein
MKRLIITKKKKYKTRILKKCCKHNCGIIAIREKVYTTRKTRIDWILQCQVCLQKYKFLHIIPNGITNLNGENLTINYYEI